MTSEAAVDRDGDAIADSADVCPSQPESYNGFQDEDGCPDKLPSRACPYSISPQVQFSRRGQITLDRKAVDTIRAVVRDFLRLYPDFRLEIRGHTAADEASDETAHFALGLRRARTVRDFMIKELGIDAFRLYMRSYGATEPYPCGQGENDDRDRRVDFNVSVSPPRLYFGPQEVR